MFRLIARLILLAVLGLSCGGADRVQSLPAGLGCGQGSARVTLLSVTEGHLWAGEEALMTLGSTPLEHLPALTAHLGEQDALAARLGLPAGPRKLVLHAPSDTPAWVALAVVRTAEEAGVETIALSTVSDPPSDSSPAGRHL